MRFLVRFKDGTITEALSTTCDGAVRLACAQRWPNHSYFETSAVECEVGKAIKGDPDEWYPRIVEFQVTARVVIP